MTYDYQTSLPAYKAPGKDQCRDKVFEAIRVLGVCNDRQISEFLNWPINRVTPRRGELETEGKIVSDGKRKGKEGRLVNWWRIKCIVIQGEFFI